MVFVHGIGQQARSQTLLGWAEPLAARLDALDRAAGGAGLVVEAATVDPASPDRISMVVGGRRIVASEALWADAFRPTGAPEVWRWSWSMSLRAFGRLVRHMVRVNMAGAQSTRAMTDMARAFSEGLTRTWLGPMRVISGVSGGVGALTSLALLATASSVVMAVSLVVEVAMLGVVLVAGLLALTVLTLVAPIPGLGRLAQPLVAGLGAFLGDATVWTRHPLRAAAMRDVVRAAVRQARIDARDVIVVAHSQGAAVTMDACFSDGVDAATTPTVIVTVGGAVSLLNRPTFGTRQPWPIADRWASTSVRWINAWAIWDPVPSGPFGRTPGEARARWERCIARGRRLRIQPYLDILDTPVQLGPSLARSVRPLREALQSAADEAGPVEGGASPPGPEEWPLYNASSLLLDHIRYERNPALVDRLAALVMDPGADLATAERYDLERRLVRTIRHRGWFGLVALPAAIAAVSTLAGVSSVVDLIRRGSDWVRSRDDTVSRGLAWIGDHGLQGVLVSVLGVGAAYAVLVAIGHLLWVAGRRRVGLSPVSSRPGLPVAFAALVPFFAVEVLMVGATIWTAGRGLGWGGWALAAISLVAAGLVTALPGLGPIPASIRSAVPPTP